MRLALGITFLWGGIALLAVAFHPLAVESGQPGPGQVINALQGKFAARDSAYQAGAGTVTRANLGEGRTATAG